MMTAEPTTITAANRREPAPPLVEVSAVTVRLGDRAVLANVSATIWPNEFVGIIGPNGAGKSTLLRLLLGLIRPTEGAVRFQGAPLRRGNPRVGYCPQDRSFDRDLPITGRAFVGFGLDGHHWGVSLPYAQRRGQIDAVLNAVGAGHLGDAPLGQLSGGEQQRLAIAQALLGQPSLLLLDEPLA
ncbi:MAG TPA: ATP-binding cassette domain-containing protein, partial [Chloroflexota bacterium]|nr:ATP-binding cassette domain-containing protein [Chloroflexota bacterium]